MSIKYKILSTPSQISEYATGSTNRKFPLLSYAKRLNNCRSKKIAN